MDETTLQPRQKVFVKKITEGHSLVDSVKLAGYSNQTDSAYSQGSRLIRNIKIITALKASGITDSYIAKSLKSTIDDGIGVKATADTSLRGIELAARLSGYLDNDTKQPGTMTQNNIYIQELKTMDNNTLNNKLDILLNDIKTLKP